MARRYHSKSTPGGVRPKSQVVTIAVATAEDMKRLRKVDVNAIEAAKEAALSEQDKQDLFELFAKEKTV